MGSVAASVRQRGPISLNELDSALVTILGARADARFIRALRPHLLAALGAGAAEVAALADIETTIGIAHPIGQAYEAGRLPLLARVNEVTRRRIRNLIADTIKLGLPRTAQTALLREQFASMRRGRRAITVARTESGIAWHTGKEAQIIDAGFPAKMWLTSRDQRVRASHITMDNQCRAPEDPFVSGAGALLFHPHDPGGGPAEIINCRCTLVPRARACGEPINFSAAALDAMWRQFIADILPFERRVMAAIRRQWDIQELELLAFLA